MTNSDYEDQVDSTIGEIGDREDFGAAIRGKKQAQYNKLLQKLVMENLVSRAMNNKSTMVSVVLFYFLQMMSNTT